MRRDALDGALSRALGRRVTRSVAAGVRAYPRGFGAEAARVLGLDPADVRVRIDSREFRGIAGPDVSGHAVLITRGDSYTQVYSGRLTGNPAGVRALTREVLKQQIATATGKERKRLKSKLRRLAP